MSNLANNRRLGRGLAALLGEGDGMAPGDDPNGFVPRVVHPDGQVESGEPGDVEGMMQVADGDDGQMLLLGVDEIEENPFQPRRDFSESELASLAESLKEHDMLQPVLVRRHEGRWQLISGERRLRAAILAGWKKIPARVRNADDRLVAELAIVENLQRKDLNPIEKALSFRRYIDQHECTQEDLARRLKIDRSTIANLMRLLELPESVQTDIQKGIVTAGHARALLPLGDEAAQVDMAHRIRREGLSVRDVEQIVQERIESEDGDGLARGRRGRKRKDRSGQMSSLEQRLRMALGTKVDIKETSRSRGQIVIYFRGMDEYERLHNLLLTCGSNPDQQRQVG